MLSIKAKLVSAGTALMSVGAYTATFETADIAPIFVDLIGGFLAAIVGFITLVALVWILGWFRSNNPFKGGKIF